MNRCSAAVLLLFVIDVMANGQPTSHSVGTLTIAAGAMTNGTLSTLESVQSFKVATTLPENMDPGLLAFSTLNNDIGVADSFFTESLRALHADEVRCGEMWFGRAFVCKVGNPKVVIATVVTQPMSIVYRHWLGRVSEDFIKFKQISIQHGKEGAELAKKMEQAYHDTSNDEGVWLKLRTGYCNEVLSGTYPDIDGQVKGCATRAN